VETTCEILTWPISPITILKFKEEKHKREKYIKIMIRKYDTQEKYKK
jgi:hypothetical protein